MKLHTLTITGADEKTDLNEMQAISGEYPFVEWGILFAPRQVARPRYPALPWIMGTARHLRKQDVALSAHICGAWSRQVCLGSFPESISPALEPLLNFERIQLNIMPKVIRKISNPAAMAACLPGRECIVTVGPDVLDGLALAKYLQGAHGKISVLFDASGGRGIAPDQWPETVDGLPCGFAGGLKPETLAAELQKLSEHVGDARIWVDMGTGVRTANDELDMDKVRRTLEIAVQYVS